MRFVECLICVASRAVEQYPNMVSGSQDSDDMWWNRTTLPIFGLQHHRAACQPAREIQSRLLVEQLGGLSDALYPDSGLLGLINIVTANRVSISDQQVFTGCTHMLWYTSLAITASLADQ